MKTAHWIGQAILIACFVAHFPSMGIASEVPAHAGIISTLEEIVALREEAWQIRQTLAQAGVVPDDGTAEIGLAEARIELARARGQSDIIQKELRRVVELRRAWVEFMEKRAVDRARHIDLVDARIALKKAELQLLQEEQAHAAGASNAGTPPGFRPLFNGYSLDGWEVRQADNRDWRVVDGIIDCDPHPGPGDRNLWATKSYGDFELLVDWRIKEAPFTNRAAKVILPDGRYKKDESGRDVLVAVPNVDSGVFLRGEHKSQVNIWCWPVGSGEVWGYRTDPRLPQEVRARVTPKLRADRPIGEWNTFRITLRGDRLRVTLNDELIIDEAQLPGIRGRGPIALQHHGDRKDGEWGASLVQFRNLYIKELN